MRLKQYLSKRDFKETSEPKSKKTSEPKSKKSSKILNFCIQKHAARRLHYDFRLEYHGVLLSWAVPKGPSLNPKDKRLAIKVEDHPLEYQYFEGVIPKGNYGAGTVEIWDRGSYTTPNAASPKEIEKELTLGLKKGHFAIILKGEKLEGEFIFQKLKQSAEDNAWLLIKKEDSFATAQDILTKNSPKHKAKKKIPDFISPMLATLIEKPFNDENWLFEIKWDGYRALAFIDQGKVQLKSRKNLLWNQTFSSITQSLEKVNAQVIFDGELVVLDSKGKSDFQLMQNYQKDRKGALYYYVFDILYKDGEDLRSLPLIERKQILNKYLKQLSLPFVRYSSHVIKNGKSFFKEASKYHLEGIMGKNISSTYQSKRSREWVKIKAILTQEVVIGGFTAPRNSRQKFGALLVGVYNDKKELNYSGHVGGGFTFDLLQKVYDQLKPLIQKKSPFKHIPKTNTSPTWVKPKLVGEVSFSEWTKDNIMRQPIFKGLRVDKDPITIKKETPKPSVKKSKDRSFSKDITLTNLDKIYWPKEKYTKGDLIQYYEKVASFILPYLKDRPIILYRFPNGIEGKSFYQKNIDFPHPEKIKTFPIDHEGKTDNYLLINDKNSLLFAVNLGSIDIHPFMSRCKNLQYPDYCVIDLDPHNISFTRVIETALTIHQILEELEIDHYCKTSGGKGLHIFIPLNGKYDFDQSRQFAEVISHLTYKKLPKITSMERNPQKRQKKIYLDYLQNKYGQSIVAPYSVRPRPKALVSTPLEWKEINENLDLTKFNIKTLPIRLKEKGDLFKPILKKGINLPSALKRIKKFL